MNKELIACERVCGHCSKKMNVVQYKDRSDGYKWEYRRQKSGKLGHRTKILIRQGSWFDKSNMTIKELESKFGKQKYHRGHCVGQ